jgi:uncharacterized protein (TIGR02147 family)
MKKNGNIKNSPPPSVYDFLDCKDYLNQWREWQKKYNSAFSQRWFARKLGIPESNASYLSAVISGRRRLSESMRALFIEALDLKNTEAEYFDILVQFSQCNGIDAKNSLFERLARFRHSKAQKINQEQLILFAKWYYPVVWNWYAMEPTIKPAPYIAQRIIPALSAQQVSEATTALESNGFLIRKANSLQPCAKHLATEPVVQSIAVFRSTMHYAQMAQTALQNVPAPQRDYNSLIFTISELGIQKVQKRIQSFHEELRELIDADENEKSVYILNTQLFPAAQK